MADPKTVTVQERLVERAIADPGALVGDRRAGETLSEWQARAARAALQSERASMEGEIAERVATEIDRYGEGLVPELRMVCDWLASHFRNDEDARAALTSSKTGDE